MSGFPARVPIAKRLLPHFINPANTLPRKEIGHVIVLVHGIGEKMWSEEGTGENAVIYIAGNGCHGSFKNIKKTSLFRGENTLHCFTSRFDCH